MFLISIDFICCISIFGNVDFFCLKRCLVSDLFTALRLLPLPDVAGDPLRLHLHDTGHHGREIPRGMQAYHVQVVFWLKFVTPF